MPIRPLLLVLATATLLLTATTTAGARAVRAVSLPAATARAGATTAMPTPLTASAIVRTLWAEREQALSTLDTSALGKVESAAIERADVAYVTSVQCKCAPQKDAHPLLQVVPEVPQSAVQPVFFAQVRTTNPRSHNHPWYLVAVAHDHGAWRLVQLTFGGYAAPAPMQSLTNSATSTPKVTGSLRARMVHLAAVLFPRAIRKTTFVTHTDYGAKIEQRVKLEAAKDGIFGLALPSGQVMSCFTAHAVDTYTYPAGVLQQSASQSQWGHAIAPGNYASITVDTAVPLCAVGSGVGSTPGALRWTYDAQAVSTTGVAA
jgi:hypothetical protein